MDITHITSLLGGIALFLYGMSIMGAGLEKLAGGKMQGVLQKLTSSTIKGVIFGTLITGVIQSSAGTVVICVGLVNSGIMTLTQSVGVIMGANIGTTVTGQLIRMADISGDSLWLTLIQPSAGTVVICVGLVNSRIMTLTQSVGVIMGANIGTTVTGCVRDRKSTRLNSSHRL